MAELLRTAIRQACRRPEADCVATLVDELQGIACDRSAVRQRATALVEAVRQQRSHASGVDHLMHEFSLSSQEGVALMCLAEALLRIPDRATADRLIRDKISHGDWQSHLGGSPSLFVNAATWGLMLTGKLVATHSHSALGSALTRILMKGGEPLIRKSVDFAMRLLGQQFVMGEDIESALLRSRANEQRGYRHSFDMLGEAALTGADAERYCAAYEMAIHAIGRAATGRGVKDGPGISVKLSALHPRYSRSQRARVMSELLPRLKLLMKLARDFDIGFNIDAEEADRMELSLDLLEALADDPELAKWDGMGFVVQAYQKRAPFVIDWLIALARRSRRRLMIRLVKGAYWDSEIKRAQVDGLPDYPVYTRKPHSDLAYLVCAGRLLAAGDAVFPQFATHNAQTLATVAEMARARGVDDYEFQCLHGMGEPLYDNVVAGPDHRPCRIYAPVGTHETLLPYLVRRLLENGANSSFVNRLVDETVTVAQLVEDPLDQVRRNGSGPHPAIPLPDALFGPGRRNSAGLDLADEDNIAHVQQALAELAGRHWKAVPLVAGGAAPGGPGQAVRNPARHADLVGTVVDADAAYVEQALAAAAAVSADWHATPAATRAAMLLNAADLLEAERLPLISLCLREAGKTWGNAVGEIREAVDFCRYYAQQLLAGHFQAGATPPGVAVCISPWNFPLSIFIGEVSAALAAGSPVIAKPAEQTPLIAHFTIGLLHRAGVPQPVLQCLPGRGETVGATLVADARVSSVVFTGSTEVARLINTSLAERPGVRLIAETGGQNAMIVDSSALAEQIVQDVLASGFDSAGQRCSALRLLCLQDDIAEPTLRLLKAAMDELVIGDPAEFATDIGPVIDGEAQGKLLAHIESMRALARPVHQLPLPAACADGCYVPPTLIEIASLDDLTGEVFGPVVHVLRYADGQLDALLAAINDLGYGLTMGVHSRIDETVGRIVAGARVGNIYVNRNMVGAVVGVQPFGGEGLSGTGPKAGGPLYLHRLGGSEETALAAHPGRHQASLHDPHSAFRRLAEWSFSAGRRELAQQCTEYVERSLLHVRFELPGPTGERNCLAFAPRGRLLCLAASDDEWLRQIAAAFATGNTVAAPDDAAAPRRRALLPKEVAPYVDWFHPDNFGGLAGVLCDHDDAALRRRLAGAPGPLLPIYLPGTNSRRYPLYRMLAERVVSTNTTAAGGNTTLMTLGA
ncbi:MAG: trifunctional transcriptional regulator/proline dehydrogenase/L-glutamate gamma-semialdehyde dehydrogenase [Betaproteobacteria bacterium HGW-Betaproteobacteria-7]|jgi:RHH-type proline utilization regulon transcriptional repressor/proline dehydrogenase/delta 1-pyrroline-5-carboxylate dehydrogenase|nr:MAG: trifunctional transcriptional regulator/proline dehydrogenase/L-glutamate gamma-semialdehyde dehydrogenase [Betaproteobacteria bacterium HGW-Betaproteobacteria-7]